MSNEILFVILGLVAGVFSGIIGLGGGVIIVPALVFIFGLSQQQAQGTTLALMVPPIGILAAYTYYQHGFVDLKIAGLICLGFILGGWFGAKIAVQLPREVLQKIFAIVLMFLSVKMFFAK
ncbi:MAG TPA: sulfite exporter TauE/SafE family protein [Ignavibacteriaceae bacterium]|nr:sulfite exporter TauE/SafE family protein [Ignavibacteriaceae bacterium]